MPLWPIPGFDNYDGHVSTQIGESSASVHLNNIISFGIGVLVDIGHIQTLIFHLLLGIVHRAGANLLLQGSTEMTTRTLGGHIIGLKLEQMLSSKEGGPVAGRTLRDDRGGRCVHRTLNHEQ